MSLAPAVFLGGEIGTRVADITYIRPHREFVDLVVLLDAFSGRCIGWLLESASEAS